MADLTQQTARQLVDTIFLAYADKRPLDATDAIDELVVREEELEDLKREAAGLRGWNEKLRARLAAAESIVARGVELMPLEQLSQWEGVREWQERA